MSFSLEFVTYAHALDVLKKRPMTYGFTAKDLVLLTRSKSRAKIQRIFERSSYNFSIYVMLDNEDGQDCPIGSTRISLRNDAKRMAEPARDRITLVLNGNQTGRYMPMNAWILAHRFGHAIQLRDKNEPETFVLDPTIFAEFEKIYNAVCIQFPITFPVFRTSLFAGGNTATDYFRCFVETLCTMRSARQGIITHIGEVMPELLAQYLISGGVRFNRVGLWDYNRFALAQPDFRGWRPISMSIRPIDKIDVASVDEMIENAEVVINKAFRDYLDSLVGKVIAF